MTLKAYLLLACALLFSAPGFASTCEAEDYELKISGKDECLIMRRFGTSTPEIMLIWLHGDVSSGGPANYHFRIAEKSASDFAAYTPLAIALVRPGYPDGSGNTSSTSSFSTRRLDHHTKVNITEVATAVERLRAHYQPKKVIAIGHSGGASTSAVMMGLKPGLVDAAVLVACPCDLVTWRTGRTPWNASENAMTWIDRIDKNAKVISLTGARDDNTLPILARNYTDALIAQGIQAEFRLIENENHNSAFRSDEVSKALKDLIESFR